MLQPIMLSKVNAKTAEKHDYTSAAWRRSYARRTAVERSYWTIKDPASNDISRGWCRLRGLAPIFVLVTCCIAVRNLRMLAAFAARRAEDARRLAAGLPPKTRRPGARPSATSYPQRRAPPRPEPRSRGPQRGPLGPIRCTRRSQPRRPRSTVRSAHIRPAFPVDRQNRRLYISNAKHGIH
jgi:hypothetical protein